MTLTWDDSPQGTSGWFAAKAGCHSSSGAKYVLGTAALRGDKGRDTKAGREDYIYKCVSERFSNAPSIPDEDMRLTRDMEWGIKNEPIARHVYEEKTGRQVSTVGFARVEGLWLGTSVDGLVYTMDGHTDRGIEIKCPSSKVHLKYVELARQGQVPDDHIRQVLHHMWVLGCDIDFVSYDPRMPSHMQLVVVELTRASVSAMLDRYEAAAMTLLRDMDALEGRLREAA